MNQSAENINDEIDLKEFFSILWNKKKLIAIITSIFFFASAIYALSLPNIYKSQALLAPKAQEESLSSNIGSFSPLASLSGVGLKATGTPALEGMERIKSFEFFSSYFLPKIKMENILAVEKWVPEKNILIYDDNKFNKEKNEWVRKKKPSSQEAFKIYKKTLSVNQDEDTSFVRISMKHLSPIVAQKWVNIIIQEVNESMRKIDADEAEQSIRFLNQTAKTTNIQPIKETIAKLLESQMKTLMLTSSNEAYVFKVIDSPIIPEEKSEPSRTIICFIGAILGAFFSIVVSFIQNYRESYNN